MLTYNMDVTPESVWKRTTPSEAELAQPYYCTEAGVFYAQQHFSTARTDKESYILFYTLRGAGLIEQGESHVVLSTGQALLLNCRTPQSYCTAPGQSCWHHYWVHLDGAGVAAMEPLLLAGKKLTPVQLTGVKMQEYFETLLAQMERSTVDSMVTAGLALHEMLALCARSILAQAEATSARQVILQAVETLRKNYQQELCLADLLAEAHMSKSYFLRLFRRYMGTTPYNYLDGAGVAAMEPLLLAGKKLTPVQLTGVKMQEYFETLLAQMERSTVDSMVTAGLALHEMLALCARSILAQAEATSARQVILQAVETLRKNYQQELCLADLLAEAHMSKSYFLRLFRRYMGTTPYNYLVNFRITQAKELLVLTDHSVSEIAQEVGFGDASNFSTRFAKATGQSPLQYRKSALKPVEGAR